jgi:putative phage-type endonuclease
MQPSIVSALSIISSHKPVAQKSAEWLAARKNLIAASEAGYLLGIKSTSSMINYIKTKCNITTSLDYLSRLESIRHGCIYEDISRAIYESRNGIHVREYGLITTSKNAILGASPDGIVLSTNPNAKYQDSSRIGRIVEIKNPYDYDPSDIIKPEYAIQILQQQYVLGLLSCDFIKTNIIGSTVNEKTKNKGLRPYYNIDAFLADVPSNMADVSYLQIQNQNIPLCNLSSSGMEKGIIIYYNDAETGQYITHLYPLETPYTKPAILEWIKTTKARITSENGISHSCIGVEYWYLAAYFEKTLEYDSHLFESIYLPRLDLAWRIIIRIRQIQERDNHSIDTILNFIDDILKPHLNKPSAFYKSIENQKEICNLLETASTLDISIASKQTVSSDEKAKTKAKTKVIIEYDF